MNKLSVSCLAALCFVLLYTVNPSHAITCYDCISGTTGCADTFSASGVDTCTGAAQCVKSKGKIGGIESVVRSCLTVSATKDGCTSAKVGGVEGTVCYCSTDHCNSATSMLHLSTVSLLVVAAFVMLFRR